MFRNHETNRHVVEKSSRNDDGASPRAPAAAPAPSASRISTPKRRITTLPVMLLAYLGILSLLQLQTTIRVGESGSGYYGHIEEAVQELLDQPRKQASLPTKNTRGPEPPKEEEHEEDWFDPYRWWHEKRRYDDGNETSDDGVYTRDVCHYVEDVCRVQGVHHWVYRQKKNPQQPQPQQPQPTIEFVDSGDEDYAYYGGDVSFFERFGHWNVAGHLRRNETIATSDHQCSYLPVANHFVLAGLYTHMLGEFYSRIFSPLAELVRFVLVAEDGSNITSVLPREDSRSSNNITTLQKTLRHRNNHLRNSTTTNIRVFAATTRFYLNGVDNQKKHILESHRAFLGLLSDHEVLPSNRFSTLWGMRQQQQSNGTQTIPPPECVCVKRLFFCGYDRNVVATETPENESPPPLHAEAPPPPGNHGNNNNNTPNASSALPPTPRAWSETWKLRMRGDIKGDYHSGSVRDFVLERVRAVETASRRQALARDYLLEKKRTAGILLIETQEPETQETSRNDNNDDDDERYKAMEATIREKMMAFRNSRVGHARSRQPQNPPNPTGSAPKRIDWNRNTKPSSATTSTKVNWGTSTTSSLKKSLPRRRLTSLSSSNHTATASTTTTTIATTPFNLTAVMANVSDEDFLKHWKVVGLTQRSDRRTWLNHGEILDACGRRFANDRILCVGIDLGAAEFRNRPEWHVAAHSHLAGLIGIHGAQLAEAVFLPERALVAELLPFVEDPGLFGDWTRHVATPTPVGTIFEKTDLTHVGVPLTIDSAEHLACVNRTRQLWKNEGRYEATDLREKCLAKEENFWDDRHFTAPVDTILDLIDKFVIESNKHEGRPCSDIRELAGDDYVLYNVQCSPTANGTLPSPHHFYRTPEWLALKTHTSLENPALLWGDTNSSQQNSSP